MYPSRYQSDAVDRRDGPLVRRANRTLRRAIMMIADNLIDLQRPLPHPGNAGWRAAGQGPPRHPRPRRQAVLPDRLPDGGRPRKCIRHPSCRERDYVLRKLSCFHAEHGRSMAQVMADLQAATDHIPKSEHAPEAKSLFEAMQPSRPPTAKRAASAG